MKLLRGKRNVSAGNRIKIGEFKRVNGKITLVTRNKQVIIMPAARNTIFPVCN